MREPATPLVPKVSTEDHARLRWLIAVLQSAKALRSSSASTGRTHTSEADSALADFSATGPNQCQRRTTLRQVHLARGTGPCRGWEAPSASLPVASATALTVIGRQDRGDDQEPADGDGVEILTWWTCRTVPMSTAESEAALSVKATWQEAWCYCRGWSGVGDDRMRRNAVEDSG